MKKDKSLSGWWVGLLCCLTWSMAIFPAAIPAAEKPSSGEMLTDQEIATEKFFSSLEASLAQKLFDYRKRPSIRVAIFDFTDSEGNVVKSGKNLVDKLTKRLYSQPQFDVVSREKMQRYLGWMGLTTMRKIDAQSLVRYRHRINTLEPENGLHAWVIGEVQKSAGRSLRISVSIINFQAKIGAMEKEENLLDEVSVTTEIPLPTEQALQEATEILVRRETRPWEEGRLVILANTRGQSLAETEYLQEIKKENPFPWGKIPYLFIAGKEEVIPPREIRIGLGNLALPSFQVKRNSLKDVEYSFLHGKCLTNETYFDDEVPVQTYRFLSSFGDPRTNERYSDDTEVQVFADTTTLVIVTFYVPGEKERIRSKQIPRARTYQLFGKGMRVWPNR
ncbi:MAG: hypothetical protein NTY64_00180 [Deltaproteobacteria bacterium]|nr:hypothetical protein [Deltaproteobacteria bacterium]